MSEPTPHATSPHEHDPHLAEKGTGSELPGADAAENSGGEVPVPFSTASSHLAEHFETSQQQFDSGTLGMWLFLMTEILLFSGLFCAYAVYRANHPDIFAYAHLYLSKTLGALNTVVLIFSSFTMAAAVRAAQLGHRRWLVVLLAITLACGCVFLSVKFVEYKQKWEEALLPGQSYRPESPPPGAIIPPAAQKTTEASSAQPVADARSLLKTGTGSELTDANAAHNSGGEVPVPLLQRAALTPKGELVIEKSTIAPAAVGDSGVSPEWLAHGTERPQGVWFGREPNNVQLFFGFYFAMTGLHGVHVIAGMTVMAWILVRAARNEFGPDYFAPVDFTGLYWHLVDLVWIFLFPLLYLIA